MSCFDSPCPDLDISVVVIPRVPIARGIEKDHGRAGTGIYRIRTNDKLSELRAAEGVGLPEAGSLGVIPIASSRRENAAILLNGRRKYPHFQACPIRRAQRSCCGRERIGSRVLSVG